MVGRDETNVPTTPACRIRRTYILHNHTHTHDAHSHVHTVSRREMLLLRISRGAFTFFSDVVYTRAPAHTQRHKAPAHTRKQTNKLVGVLWSIRDCQHEIMHVMHKVMIIVHARIQARMRMHTHTHPKLQAPFLRKHAHIAQKNAYSLTHQSSEFLPCLIDTFHPFFFPCSNVQRRISNNHFSTVERME